MISQHLVHENLDFRPGCVGYCVYYSLKCQHFDCGSRVTVTTAVWNGSEGAHYFLN